MPSSNQTTQDFLPIEEIRDGVAVMKDGALVMILMASSLNFALKSADEQEAVILQYQNFLNSLDFSTQVYIQSRRRDIRPYVLLLEERLKEQTNELLKIQTHEYIQFIKNFTETTAIMSKSFYVVIPYTPPVFGKGSDGGRGLLGLFGKRSSSESLKAKRESFEENRSQLEQRASVVAQGLVRTGVRVTPLGTEELVELYYKIFNPGELERPVI